MWKEDLDRRFPMLMRALYMLAALALVLLILKVAVAYLLPFLIALLMALAMEPLIRFLARLKFPRSLAVAVAMVVYFGLLFAAGFLVTSRLVAEVVDLSGNIPDYGRFLTDLFNDLAQWGRSMYLRLPKEVIASLQDSLLSLTKEATRLLTSLAGSIIHMLTSLPDLLMFAMFTLIATYFIARDRHKFREFSSRLVPAPTYAKLLALNHSLGHSLLGFLKAQLMLMTLTFTECFIGLSLIGIRYALVISLFTALVDILPVLGTGTVLVPWALIALIMGKTTTGLSLLALYLVIMVIRYVLEPRIVGSLLGLHPLVSLIAMFVGLKALGVVGLILGPAIVVTVQAFMRSGLMPQFKE
jgi:sporulation integral membrane protein YtvI